MALQDDIYNNYQLQCVLDYLLKSDCLDLSVIADYKSKLIEMLDKHINVYSVSGTEYPFPNCNIFIQTEEEYEGVIVFVKEFIKYINMVECMSNNNMCGLTSSYIREYIIPFVSDYYEEFINPDISSCTI